MKNTSNWRSAAICCVAYLISAPAEAQHAQPATTDTAPVIVMLGDSVTERGLPAQVKKQLDAQISAPEKRPIVINAGKGYDNATSALERLQKDVLDHHPDFVTVSFGLNDTGGRKPGQFKESINTIVETLHTNGIQVVLLTSTPFNNELHGWGKSFESEGGLDEYMDRAFCEAMRTLADGQDVLLCDLHGLFTDAFKRDADLITALISSDGVHLTGAGNLFAATHIAPVLHALLRDDETATDDEAADVTASELITVAPWAAIAIDEPGFEGDGSWAFGQSGAGVNGFFGKPHSDYITPGFIDPVPDRGTFFAYNNGPQHDLYQVLEDRVAANTAYTLTVVAIDSTFVDPFPGGELRLGYVSERAGERDDFGLNLMTPFLVNAPVPLNGPGVDDAYETWIYVFVTDATPAGLGRPLRIEVIGGGAAQALFDNVRLEAAPVPASE